jgi:hypothetical protein
MKKAKTKTGNNQSTKVSGAKKKPGKPADLTAIRLQISNLVGHQAVAMVETTMDEAEKGHYVAMKYLFEMIGLYPTAALEEAPGEDSLARTLLRRLGLPEEPRLATVVTKDCAAEETAGAEDAVK